MKYPRLIVLAIFGMAGLTLSSQAQEQAQIDSTSIDSTSTVAPALQTDSLVPETSPKEKLTLRAQVDSLRLNDAAFVRQIWGQRILDSLPIFQESWATTYVWPSTSDHTLNGDTLVIDLLEDDESFYFNYWGEFFWPYGPRWGRMHRGLDLGLDIGDTVRTSFNGVVRYAQYKDGGYGNCIVIRHFNGLETLYAHLDEILINSGELVLTGEVIGLGGTTGRSTGPHLHYEWRYKGKSFNSEVAINVDSLQLKTDTVILTDSFLNDPPSSVIAKTARKKKYHTVKSGENLWVISRKYKVSIKQLKSWNNLKTDVLQIGQKLRIN